MRRTLSLALLAAVFALGGAFLLNRGPAAPGQTSFALPGAAMAQDAPAAEPTGDIDTSTVIEMAQGSPDAPVTVIEYASFTCPHCAAFHSDQYKQLKADYIDTGKVRFIFREVYFDRFGLWASMIARCGGEMRFFGITEILYETQRDWIGDQQPATIAENLRQIGRTAGMDDATLDACMQDETSAQTLVAWFTENAERDGIDSTPTLIIDGTKYSNMAYEEMKPLIEAALAD